MPQVIVDSTMGSTKFPFSHQGHDLVTVVPAAVQLLLTSCDNADDSTMLPDGRDALLHGSVSALKEEVDTLRAEVASLRAATERGLLKAELDPLKEAVALGEKKMIDFISEVEDLSRSLARGEARAREEERRSFENWMKDLVQKETRARETLQDFIQQEAKSREAVFSDIRSQLVTAVKIETLADEVAARETAAGALEKRLVLAITDVRDALEIETAERVEQMQSIEELPVLRDLWEFVLSERASREELEQRLREAVSHKQSSPEPQREAVSYKQSAPEPQHSIPVFGSQQQQEDLTCGPKRAHSDESALNAWQKSLRHDDHHFISHTPNVTPKHSARERSPKTSKQPGRPPTAPTGRSRRATTP